MEAVEIVIIAILGIIMLIPILFTLGVLLVSAYITIVDKIKNKKGNKKNA